MTAALDLEDGRMVWLNNIEYNLLRTEKKKFCYFRKDVIAIGKRCTVLKYRNKCKMTAALNLVDGWIDE
jgi:hypothetical protein